MRLEPAEHLDGGIVACPWEGVTVRVQYDGPEVWDVAIAEAERDGATEPETQLVEDMKARDRLGRERYGTPLQPHNGRDALRDLYEEVLDAIAYATQVRLEADHDPARLWASDLCRRLRAMALEIMAARDAEAERR